MTDDEIKKIEQRGYARGYSKGRTRLESDIQAEQQYASRKDFLDAAFLTVFPACASMVGWKRGDQPIQSVEDRTALAWDFAEAALKLRRYP